MSAQLTTQLSEDRMTLHFRMEDHSTGKRQTLEGEHKFRSPATDEDVATETESMRPLLEAALAKFKAKKTAEHEAQHSVGVPA